VILLGLVAIALAIVYAAHVLRDELRAHNAFLRRLVYVIDAEHTARIERDTVAAAHAAPPPRPRRSMREPAPSPTAASATASPPPPARGVLHAPTLAMTPVPQTPERSDV
jgi:hypothetical protein